MSTLDKCQRIVVLACIVGGVSACRAQKPAGPRPLVVFLHGMIDAGHASIDADLERRFDEAGFEVLAPKGRVGLCDWSEEAKAARCWPSDERRLDVARALVAEWRGTLAPGRPTVVVGFSNGGAFATLLAVHGLVPACGFATMHGFPAGSLHAEAAQPAPLLLIGGKAAPWESGQLAATTKQLDASGWPYQAKMHDGGHTIDRADVNAVIAFTRDVAREGCMKRE